jgi:S1-C subfamily serine protease
MNRLMFVYLSGTEKGKTRIFAQDHMTIGTSDACDLTLVAEEDGTLPEGVLADIYDDEGVFHFVPRDEAGEVGVKINGESLASNAPGAGYEIHDGDSVQFGDVASGASVLFQVLPENFSQATIARRADRGLQQPDGRSVHPLTATLFVKELTASLWAEIPRRAKWLAMFAVALIFVVVVGLLAFGLIALMRNANKTERLTDQIGQLQAQRDQDLQLMKSQQERIEKQQEIIEQRSRFTTKIAERFSPGVCLIVGSYSFAERGTGRVLRYMTADAANDIPIDKDFNLQASVDGAGPPVTIDYTGTGFVVGDGVIATNKHVVQPWLSDRVAQFVLQEGAGLVAKLDTLEAFFPGVKTPFAMKVASSSSRYDVALCTFEPGDTALPEFPLSTEDPRSIIGESVVLIGYPTGVDGLLQRIEESERRDILKLHGQSVADVALGLSERGLVRPLTTTGTVSGALTGRIVHSAQTTEGGSGSPIFDSDGRVIAINSAILTTVDGNQSFGGSNFGVPIKVVAELIQSFEKRAKNNP